jgi:hypothetical protein
MKNIDNCRLVARIPALAFFIPLITVFYIGNCYSQDSTLVSNRNYTIKTDDKISSLLDKYGEYNRKKEFAEGYRIQIMYTDVRDEVYKNKGAMYKDFPDLPSYVEYEQPYYKLRVGDFKTRLEATYYLQQVTVLYTGAFIVKDKIKIR